ncbi:hypothetical protein EYZ11_005406 [Aspergillus tanneri]|uniref:N-acetyltransferase domain-containing protein n=1 Tax=Aspergillus tanneri TaxID=1220188 RepID=A0A4S3JIE6_9EURO|nr:uncharacterized protein ATNIH1004_006698 [Aspergillus tanneri]KAA8645279.1 hypothetical protein ATNIH1004_006698 [Aspergillus tanneri]THC95122.1 hypothetical protein EYZ11_005406 [Aspergillus tanneri]
MLVQTRYATESDVCDIAGINITSFRPQPFYQTAFANVNDSSLYPLKYARLLNRLGDPTAHVHVATDAETGQVVGSARWVIPGHLLQRSAHQTVSLSEDAKCKAADPGRFMPPGVNQQAYTAFLGMLNESRKKNLKDGDMSLDFLAILPAYQGNGIGTQLLKWGMGQADALNARIYLEASAEGYPLYCKYGWKVIEEIVLDFGVFGGRNTATYFVMMRDPVPNREENIQ